PVCVREDQHYHCCNDIRADSTSMIIGALLHELERYLVHRLKRDPLNRGEWAPIADAIIGGLVADTSGNGMLATASMEGGAHLLHWARMVADLKGVQERLETKLPLDASELIDQGLYTQQMAAPNQIGTTLFVTISPDDAQTALAACIQTQTGLSGEELRGYAQDRIDAMVGRRRMYGFPPPDLVILAWPETSNLRVSIRTGGRPGSGTPARDLAHFLGGGAKKSSTNMVSAGAVIDGDDIDGLFDRIQSWLQTRSTRGGHD
ncbi:hypothetical protein ACFL6C_14525, partial [Myxococcota bacterium]